MYFLKVQSTPSLLQTEVIKCKINWVNLPLSLSLTDRQTDTHTHTDKKKKTFFTSWSVGLD